MISVVPVVNLRLTDVGSDNSLHLDDINALKTAESFMVAALMVVNRNLFCDERTSMNVVASS